MTPSRIVLSAIALATTMAGLAVADVANASKPIGPKPPQRWPSANTRPVVVAPPKPTGPLAGKTVASKPPVVVAPPKPNGPLAGKPYRPYRPYRPVLDASNKPGGVAVGTRPNTSTPPVVVAPPKPNGPLAGKPPVPYRPYRPVTDASNAPGGVVVVTKPRPVKPVTCIGWC